MVGEEVGRLDGTLVVGGGDVGLLTKVGFRVTNLDGDNVGDKVSFGQRKKLHIGSSGFRDT